MKPLVIGEVAEKLPSKITCKICIKKNSDSPLPNGSFFFCCAKIIFCISAQSRFSGHRLSEKKKADRQNRGADVFVLTVLYINVHSVLCVVGLCNTALQQKKCIETFLLSTLLPTHNSMYLRGIRLKVTVLLVDTNSVITGRA